MAEAFSFRTCIITAAFAILRKLPHYALSFTEKSLALIVVAVSYGDNSRSSGGGVRRPSPSVMFPRGNAIALHLRGGEAGTCVSTSQASSFDANGSQRRPYPAQ